MGTDTELAQLVKQNKVLIQVIELCMVYFEMHKPPTFLLRQINYLLTKAKS